jgi:hypothetical protein
MDKSLLKKYLDAACSKEEQAAVEFFLLNPEMFASLRVFHIVG